MGLVERGREMAVLEDMYRDCLRGWGGVAIVGGEVASGKTTILYEFAKEVEAAGGIFLSAMGSRAERDFPLSVMEQVFANPNCRRNGGADLASLLDAEMLALARHRAEHGTGRPLSLVLLRRLVGTLLCLSGESPVVIGIDDVHHADEESLECLLFLVRRMRSARVLVVLSACDRPDPEVASFQAELLRQPRTGSVWLKNLSERGVAELLAQNLPGEDDPALAAAFYEASAGSPLLMRALLEDYRPQPGVPSPDDLPGEAFAQAVTACLYRGDLELPDVARALAVLGTAEECAPFLAEVLDLEPGRVAAMRDVLAGMGLLNSDRFRVAATRTAILRTMSDEESALMHERVARALRARGAAPSTVARHLVAAEGWLIPWAPPVLLAAGEQALDEDKVALAIDYLGAAAKAEVGEHQQAMIRMALARAEWRRDPATAARHLPYLVKAALGGNLDCGDMIVLMDHLFWHGERVYAAAIHDALLHRFGDRLAEGSEAVPSGVARSPCHRAHLAFPHGFVQGHGQERDRAAEDGEGAPPYGTAVKWPDHGAPAEAERTLETTRLGDRTLMTILTALITLIYTNRLDSAAGWCEILSKEAAGRQAPTWEAILASCRATVEVRRGRMACAERLARTALARLPARGWGVAIGMPVAVMVLTTTAMGRYEEAAAHLAVPVPDAMFQTLGGLHYLHARGRYHLAVGRPHAALDDFQKCGDLMGRWEVDLPMLAPWRIDAARACIILDRERQARQLVSEQIERLGPEHTRTMGVSLRVLAEMSDLEQRPGILGQAVAALEEFDDRYELALATAELAGAQYALGAEHEAVALVHRASRLAEECGVELPKASLPDSITDPLPAAVPGPLSPVDELSDAELRVAALAAQGNTNRQIAGRLFITVSTVEQHLTRVYRKLKVKRRRDLPVELLRRQV